MVESMKQVSENYLSTEKGYADDWAAYIASCHMTAEEAPDYQHAGGPRGAPRRHGGPLRPLDLCAQR